MYGPKSAEITCAKLRWFDAPPPRVTKWVSAAFISLAAVVMLPLTVAFMQTAIQPSDVLTGPDMFYSPKGDFTSARELLPNYLHALLRSTYLVRPTQVLINNIQYVLFGPEPGAMYAVKWALKFASALLIVVVLKRLNVDELSRYAAAVLVLFHPACLDPLLWSADGQAAFLMLATIALSLKYAPDGGIMRIEQLTRSQYAALFAVWFLLLGVKEICFVMCGCLALLWQLSSLRSARAWLRLSPFFAALVFWAYRLAAARSGSAYSLSISDVAERLAGNLRLICPPSPYELLGGACLLLMLLALVPIWRQGSSRVRWSLLLFAAAAIGGLLFISIPAVSPSARYNLTVIYLLAMIVGVGMAQLPRMAWPVKPLFVLVVPALMAGDLYSQTLAFVQDTYEFNEVLNLLERRAGEGYHIACSGQFFESEGLCGREAQDTVMYYFGKYGPRFYGLPTARQVYFLQDGQKPPAHYQLLTTYSPASLEKGAIPGLDVGQIRNATQVVRERQGLLARMTNRYLAFAHLLGNDHWPVYDCGTFVLSGTPRYFVYTVEEHGDKRAGPIQVAQVAPYCRTGAFIR